MPLLEQVGTPLGASGLSLVSNQSWTADEYNVDLATPQVAVKTYDRMKKSDAQVRRSLNNLLYALLSAQWRIDAADTPDGEKHAEFVRSVLMPGETTGYASSYTWLDLLRNALGALSSGFTVFEKVWGFRPADGKNVWAAVELRMPKTIAHWNLSPKGPSELVSVTQWAWKRDGQFYTIDIPVAQTSKSGGLIVFTFNREGDNYWGESILRPAHFHWRRKRDILKWNAITLERMGGIYWISVREGKNPTAEQISAAKRFVQNFRLHEKQGAYLPSEFEFHIEFPSGEGADFIGAAEYDDRMIEGTMFSQWQSLGTGDKGALSVGNVQLDMMLLSYQAVMKWIEDVFSGPQGIVELIDMNFGEQELYPRLAGENFLQMKPDRLATVMTPLVEKGIVRVDQPIRVFFRDRLGLPEEDEATLEPAPGQLMAQALAQGGKPGQPGSPANRPEERETERPTEKLRKVQSPAYSFRSREPMPHETGVDWASMQRYLDEAPERLWYREVLPIRERQIRTLALAASIATDAELAAGQLPKAELAELGKAIGDGLVSNYRSGRASVLREYRRARVRKAEDEDDGDQVAGTKKQEAWIRRLGTALALGMTLKLLGEAGRAGMDAKDRELDQRGVEAEVRRALDDLSKPVVKAELAGKVTQAFTTGRVEQGQALSDEIQSVYYSALMDNETCGPCAAMDGAELDKDTFGSQVPNPRCDWPPNCRCEPVFVWREEARVA